MKFIVIALTLLAAACKPPFDPVAGADPLALASRSVEPERIRHAHSGGARQSMTIILVRS